MRNATHHLVAFLTLVFLASGMVNAGCGIFTGRMIAPRSHGRFFQRFRDRRQQPAAPARAGCASCQQTTSSIKSISTSSIPDAGIVTAGPVIADADQVGSSPVQPARIGFDGPRVVLGSVRPASASD